MHDQQGAQHAHQEEHQHGVLHELNVMRVVVAGVDAVAPTSEGVEVIDEVAIGVRAKDAVLVFGEDARGEGGETSEAHRFDGAAQGEGLRGERISGGSSDRPVFALSGEENALKALI